MERRWAAVTGAIAAVILWGSFYPFHFYARGTAEMAWRYLLLTRYFGPDRGDVISNILLYAPLGYFAVRSLGGRGFALRVGVVALGGAMLSGAIEYTQFWDGGRAPSVFDFYSNAAGALGGALAAGLHPRQWRFPWLGRMEWHPYVVLLALFWLGNRLFPYVPAFDWRGEAAAWQRLLEHISALEVFRQTMNWLAVALLLEALFGAKSRMALAMLAAGVVAGRVLIGIAAPADEFSALLAVLLWMGLSRSAWRAGLIAGLFAISVTLQTLTPFHLLARPRRFGWTPFLSFINGPRENGVRVFFDKAFSYGAIVWLMGRAGWSWAAATAVCGAGVFALHVAQIYLPGRSAEITDFAMLVMLAWIMKLMHERPRRY